MDNEIKGNSTILPSGSTLQAGTHVSVRVDETTNTSQSWDSTNNTLGPVQDNTLQWQNCDLYVMDGFLIYYPSSMSRQMAPRT